MKQTTTWQEIDDTCQGCRESDGFCRVNCSCSGPTYSNLACDIQDPDRPGSAMPVRGACGFMGWVEE